MNADWLDSQLLRCTMAIEESISATHLTMSRPGFGQIVVPAKGSVLASPVQAHWDPNPDYFFDWQRDSALVMSAVNSLIASAPTAQERQHWEQHFSDYVHFNLQINQINGHGVHAQVSSRTLPAYQQFLRPADELDNLKGDKVLADTRVNADGTPDHQDWSRPQYDGPALRALTCMGHDDLTPHVSPSAELITLTQQNLDFTARHADEPCIGPWEEDCDQHYYTSVVQLGALHHGAIKARLSGDMRRADLYADKADLIRINLEQHWDEQNGFYRASCHKKTDDPEEQLDIAVLLGVLHARLPDGPHSIHDPRVARTVTRLEELFLKQFPLNRSRSPDMGIAMGRYKTDQYQGGNPWYFATLGLAEYFYRTGKTTRADAVMNMVRHVTPSDGSLSEQFDKCSGDPRSAQRLTWSAASFVTAVMAQRASSLSRNISNPYPQYQAGP